MPSHCFTVLEQKRVKKISSCLSDVQTVLIPLLFSPVSRADESQVNSDLGADFLSEQIQPINKRRRCCFQPTWSIFAAVASLQIISPL